jgi:leucyl aminopeptidase
MQLSALFAPLAGIEADWLIVCWWENEGPSAALAGLDAALGGALSRLKEAGDVTGKAGELTTLLTCPGIAARRLLVVGVGTRAKADRAALTTAAATATRAITCKALDRIALGLPENVPGLSWEDVAIAAGAGLTHGAYGPGLRKTKQERFAPKSVVLVAPPTAPSAEVKRGAARADVEGRAVQLTRELVNTPPCDLYPETFAARAQHVAAAHGVECTVLDQSQIEAERMGALLGVAQGSVRPPRFVVLRYRGGTGRTLGLVGKGVTFDSGGLSLKTNEQMLDMKCDMAGAATVLAAVQAIAELKLPVNVDGYLPLVENLPSGHAMKLGDVLLARGGKTIEIHNTDAEGRLILADALAYAVDQKVDHLVDLATLTGACMIALGTEVAGLMTNNETWGDQVRAAAGRVGEMVWPLPMLPHYGEYIKSNVADIKNTGNSRYDGGAITAAKFLEEFVGDVPWAHLDIAGPAWAEHDAPSHDAGGTGRYVRTLVELARAYGEPAG